MARYVDYIVNAAPPWLQRERGAAFLRAIGLTLDLISDGVKEAVKARFPTLAAPDAKNEIGTERSSVRATVLGYETNDAYGLRLQRLWDDAVLRGTKAGVLEILRVIGTTALAPWTYAVYDLDEWNPGYPWADGWICLQAPHPWVNDDVWGGPGTWGDGGTWGSSATPDQVANYRAVVKPWIPAHARVVTIVHLDGELWGEPGTWGDPGTWGGHVAQWPT